jgi:hypothetical protein
VLDHVAGPPHDAEDPEAVVRRRDARVALAAGALAALAGGAVLLASLREHLPSDFEAHIGFTIRGLDGDPLPGNFLFYALNGVFAGFSTDMRLLKLSLVLVLAAAIGAKVWLSVRYVAAERRAASHDRGPLPLWGAAAALLCAVAFSLPVGGRHYLGQIPPNVWHNSTTILLMPFALGLFWTTLCFLRSGDRVWLWRSLPLAALNLAAKPSFVLCLLPALALVALVHFRLSRPLRDAALLLAALVALLALQSVYVYVADPATADGGSGLAVSPLHVWHAFSDDIPLSLLASGVFPLAALALGGAAVRDSLAVRYAVVLVLAGIAEYALLAERGPREFDGNFTWQAIVSMWVLFVALVGALVPAFQRRPFEVRKLTIAAAFLVQVVAGALYLQHWFSTGSFV